MYVIYPRDKEDDFKFEYHRVVGEKLKGDVKENREKSLRAIRISYITNKLMNSLTAKLKYGQNITFTAYLPEEFN